jgi:ParB-like chromosome segregation protein Spo0J
MPATEAPPETLLIPVGQVVADHERVQPRTKLDEDAVDDYAAVIADLPPIEVFRVVAEGKFYVTNGFHRLEGALKAGLDEIPAEVVGEGTVEQATLKATENASNRRSGLRLTRADKRRSVRLTLLCPATAGWTDDQVADHCGFSRGLVTEVRREMGREGLVDPDVPKVRRDGKPLGQPAISRAGRSLVDGVEQDDPPDVAEARASGLIPDGVIPVVSRDSADAPARTPEPADEPEEDELSWVNGLPLASLLQGDQLASFRREAAFYRRFNGARKAATAAYAGIKAGIGREYGAEMTPYEDRVVRSLRIDGPENWAICPPPGEGGCDGTGKDVLGKCMKCRGAGYLVG